MFFRVFILWGIHLSLLKLFIIDYHMSRGGHWFWLQQLIFLLSLKFSLCANFSRLYIPEVYLRPILPVGPLEKTEAVSVWLVFCELVALSWLWWLFGGFLVAFRRPGGFLVVVWWLSSGSLAAGCCELVELPSSSSLRGGLCHPEPAYARGEDSASSSSSSTSYS